MFTSKDDDDRESWLRFDDDDDVHADEWIVIAKVRAAYRATVAQDDGEGP